MQWTLSSQLESDFLFERSADAFFQPHDVTQLANGNLLVMDDGSNRPGCYLGVTKECFSRAVMYSLDPACDDGGDDADDGADGATAYRFGGARRDDGPPYLVSENDDEEKNTTRLCYAFPFRFEDERGDAIDLPGV